MSFPNSLVPLLYFLYLVSQSVNGYTTWISSTAAADCGADSPWVEGPFPLTPSGE